MSTTDFGPPDLRSKLIAAPLAALLFCGCGRSGPAVGSEVTEAAPPVLAAADSFTADPTLILEPDNEKPAPLAGLWTVATGGRSCSLSLVVEENEVSGQTAGCTYASEVRPIAIGLVSGSSFLFQTGRGSEGWIWSGRYNREQNALEGRREHVITGQLESFVAQR